MTHFEEIPPYETILFSNKYFFVINNDYTSTLTVRPSTLPVF